MYDQVVSISEATTVSSFGGAMVLNNLQCMGSEAALMDCPSGLLTICGINEIAGVRCIPRTGALM